MKFSRNQIKQLRNGYSNIQNKYPDFVLKCSNLFARLPKKKAKEYLQHGFMRRLGTIKRCIENIYRIWPPERSNLLSQEERVDTVINLQAFVFNIYGSLDNLLLVFAIVEKEMKPRYVKELKDYLDSSKYKTWRKYLKNFRHALAHRIPLYVPPFALNPKEAKRYLDLDKQEQEVLQKRDFNEYLRLGQEQNAIGTNCLLMTHSFSENAEKVVFHSQILADFNTVIKVANKLTNGLLKSEIIIKAH